jgi:glutamyl-tRNA synthetase
MPFLKEGAKTILNWPTTDRVRAEGPTVRASKKNQKQLTRSRASACAPARPAEARRWDVFALETELKSFAESEGVGFGKFGPSSARP